MAITKLNDAVDRSKVLGSGFGGLMMRLKLIGFVFNKGLSFSSMIISVCMFALLACQGDHSEDSSQDAKLKTEPENIIGGSISSGGGGTILAKPVSQATVSESIGKIKRDMNLFLNYMSFGHPDAAKIVSDPDSQFITNFQYFDWYPLFIDDIEKTRSIIETTPVLDSMDAPCFFQGNETDGSFLADDGICLSSMRLQAKLNQLDYYPQLFALAVHEYAHALGALEDKAQQIQKDTLNLFADASASLIENTFEENNQSMSFLLSYLGISSAKDSSTGVINNFQKIKFQVPSSPLRFLSFDNTGLLTNFSIHNLNLKFAADAIDGDHRFFDELYGDKEIISCIDIFEKYLTPVGKDPNYAFGPTHDCMAQRLVTSSGDTENFDTNTDLTDSFHKVLDSWIGGDEILHPLCDPNIKGLEENSEQAKCDPSGRIVLESDITN